MNIEASTLWMILGGSVVLLALILAMGKSKLGDEDDLWTATELCEILALAIKVPSAELIAMWGQPTKHGHLAQKAADLIDSVNRKWTVNSQDESKLSVSVHVQVKWKNGQNTQFSGQPHWDDLPQTVRAHFINSAEPLTLAMRLPFHTVSQGDR